MSCRDVDRLLTAFVDGELDPARASAVRGHTRTCERCAGLVAHELRVRDGLGSLAAAEPPAEMWTGIQARLAEAEIADAARSRWWVWWQGVRPLAYAGALAAVTAALAIAYVVGSRPRPADQLAVIGERGAVGPASGSGAVLFHERRAAEWRAAEARYRGAIAELRELVAEDRNAWDPTALAAFETRLRALDDRVAGLAAQAGAPDDNGDALLAAYREQLAMLQDAALLGAPP
jgi:anti-sigma factor RsiW